MRWIVEVNTLGSSSKPPQRMCLEASNWQNAIKAARHIAGLEPTLRNFSIEVLDDGLRAVDPSERLRYLVKKTCANEPLTHTDSGPISSQPPPRNTPVSVPAPGPNPARNRTLAYGHQPFELQHPKSQPSQTAAPRSAKLVFKREQEPTSDSPLTYREYAYALQEGASEQQAREYILEAFGKIKRQLASAPEGKLVNLAVFDHVFDQRPLRAPLVTLVWKDWRGDEPELRYPARPGASIPAASLGRASSPGNAIALNEPRQKDDVPTPPSTPVAIRRDSNSPKPRISSKPPAQAPKATALQLAADDVVADIFGAMHDLAFLRDVREGADFVLRLAVEKLRITAGMVQLYDINRREFVVAAAVGAGAKRVIGGRTSERDPLLTEVMARKVPFAVDATRDVRLKGGRWSALGLPRQVLVCAVVQSGRFLGTVEIADPADDRAFSKADQDAVAYMAERFAEFVAARGLLFDKAEPR